MGSIEEGTCKREKRGGGGGRGDWVT